MPEPTTSIMAIIGAALTVASKLLDKTPDYPETVSKKLHELNGKYETMKTMGRGDKRFSTEKLFKLQAEVNSFMVTLATEITNAERQKNA